MKISENYIRKLIKRSLLKEDSMNAYARFVRNMEKLALFSEKSLSMQHYKKDNPALYEKIKGLGQKLVKKIQGDFPGTLDLDIINAVINKAKKDKRDNPSIDYGERVIELSDNLWFNNINKGSSRAEGNFYTADPKARGVAAKSLDRTLKHAWKEEANQPENKEFWNNFEVWHAVGGIVGVGGRGFNHETVFKFLEDFKNNNPHELSAYGMPGKSENKLNSGISDIINNSSGWKDKVHIRLDGEITFAANFDITTQWLSLKAEDTKEFEKAADFNKLLSMGSEYGGMITGPKDELISGQDTYNEIVIKDSKATAIVLPDAFFNDLKSIGDYKFNNTNMFTIGQLINAGDLDRATQELLDNFNSTYARMSSNWYAQDLTKLFKAMLDGNISIFHEDNRAVKGIETFLKYLDINIPIFNIAGQNVTNSVKKAIINLKACLDFVSNKNVPRKTMSMYEWLKKNKQKSLNFIDKYLKYIDPIKFPKTVEFMKSKEGKEYIRDKAEEFKLGILPFDYSAYEEDFNNPKKFFAKDVPFSMMSDNATIPMQMYYMINMGIIFSAIENKHPLFTELSISNKATPQTPPSHSAKTSRIQRKSNNIIMPPYFITINWRENPTGKIKTYTDDINKKSNFRDHQNNIRLIKNMLDRIVNNGGIIENFAIYDPEIKSFVSVKNKLEIDKLTIPPLLPPQEEKVIAECITINEKDLSRLIRKIL